MLRATLRFIVGVIAGTILGLLAPIRPPAGVLESDWTIRLGVLGGSLGGLWGAIVGGLPLPRKAKLAVFGVLIGSLIGFFSGLCYGKIRSHADESHQSPVPAVKREGAHAIKGIVVLMPVAAALGGLIGFAIGRSTGDRNGDARQ